MNMPENSRLHGWTRLLSSPWHRTVLFVIFVRLVLLFLVFVFAGRPVGILSVIFLAIEIYHMLHGDLWRITLEALALEAISLVGGRYGRWAVLHLFKYKPLTALTCFDPASPSFSWRALSPEDWTRMLAHSDRAVREKALLICAHVSDGVSVSR